MPAPVPVTVRYGSPTGQLALAAGAGLARHAGDEARRRYDEWLYRLSLDNALIRQQAAQSHERNMAAFGADLDRERFAAATANAQLASGLQQAYQNQRLAQADAHHRDRIALSRERLEAQKAGTLSGRGAAKPPVQLVPATGDINAAPPGPEMVTTDDGRTVIRSTGGEKPEMVPLSVRQNLDTIEAMVDLDAPARDYLRQMARSGATIGQIAVERRSFVDRTTNALLARDAVKNAAELQLLDSLIAAGPKAAASYAKEQGWVGDLDRYDENAIQQIVAQRRAALESIVRQQRQPIRNSNGASPLGGNDPALQARVAAPAPAGPTLTASGAVLVTTPEEAARLPVGTKYQTPDGRVFVR